MDVSMKREDYAPFVEAEDSDDDDPNDYEQIRCNQDQVPIKDTSRSRLEVTDDEEMMPANELPSTDLPSHEPISPDVVVIKDETQEIMLADVLPKEKPTRLVFDCVLLPTYALVLNQKKEITEDNFKVKLLKNPKVKRKADLELNPNTIRNRLKPIGLDIQDQYFTIDQATREVMVTRLFMSAEYGGSSVRMFPEIAESRVRRHGMDDFMYMNTDFQPHAPEVPGAPGLYFDTVPAYGVYKNQRTLTKIQDVDAVHNDKWLYVGQTDSTPADPPFLTVEEWSAQSPKFHSKWASAIISKNWGGVCPRILARRELGREPTSQEIEEVASRKLKYKGLITQEEVKAAYSSGSERMGVWTLKCVGYDNEFQLQLSQKFPTWVPPPRKPRKIKG